MQCENPSTLGVIIKAKENGNLAQQNLTSYYFYVNLHVVFLRYTSTLR